MILKLGMQHWGIKLHKVYINDDPWLTLTYFTARSNLVAYVFEWGKLLQSHLMVKSCSKWLTWQKIYVFEENLTLGCCLPLCRGYIHVYDHYLQTSSSQKRFGQLKPNFLWSLFGKWGHQFINMVFVTWPRWPSCLYMVKTLKIFISFYIDDDFGLT